MAPTHILILGTGAFAARILFDLAATASEPTHIVLAGRNAQRLQWLSLAANARSHIFGRNVLTTRASIDLTTPDATQTLLARYQPRVVMQAASPQASSVIAQTGNAWTDMVARAGLSLTTVFQTYFSSRVARAIAEISPASLLINGCYPDVSNSLIRAQGLPITSGVGNVAILSAVFAASAAGAAHANLKVAAHYQTLTPWRQPAPQRHGPPPRVWFDDKEVEDVFGTFTDTLLTREPVIDVSGATGVPMMLAMAHQRPWQGHAPGPAGLPGGYPVRWADGSLTISPPAGVTAETLITWNAAFEKRDGLYVDETGAVHYTGIVRDVLARASPALADGFHIRDIEQAHTEMIDLRARLCARAS